MLHEVLHPRSQPRGDHLGPGLRDGGMGRQESDRHPVVTGPRALANLTSSSRRIASVQHFPCEALVASCSGLRWPPVCRKSPAPPQRQLPTRIGRGRAIWQRRFERKQSYPSAETPDSDVGRKKERAQQKLRFGPHSPASERDQLQGGSQA